jgi:hypothetical protein
VIVIDASATVSALLNVGPARAALSSEVLHAPHLIDTEVANALRRQVAATRPLACWNGSGSSGRTCHLTTLPMLPWRRLSAAAFSPPTPGSARHLACAARLRSCPGNRLARTRATVALVHRSAGERRRRSSVTAAAGRRPMVPRRTR